MCNLRDRIPVVQYLWPARRRNPDDEPISADEHHNSLIVRGEVPLTNLAFGLASFYALFAIQLGASNQLVGWLTSGPALVNLLWLIPCGRLVQRAASYKTPVLVGMGVQRLLLACIALTPFLPATWRAPALVILVSASTIPQSTWILAFQSAVSEMFSPRRMIIFMGQRWSIGSITNMAFNAIVGRLLDMIAFPLNFQSVFFGSSMLSQSSLWLISRLRLPPRPVTPAQSTRFSLLDSFRIQPAFLRFEVAVLIGYVAIYAAQPLFAIYWVRELGANAAWVGLVNALYLLGNTLGNLLWGRWCNLGHDRRNLLIAAGGMMAGYPLLTAAFHSLTPLLVVGFVAGFFAGGNELQIFNRMIQLSPPQARPTFIAAHNFVLSIAGVAAPLVSTALVGRLSAPTTLTLAGLFGLIGAGCTYVLCWGRERPDLPEVSVEK